MLAARSPQVSPAAAHAPQRGIRTWHLAKRVYLSWTSPSSSTAHGSKSFMRMRAGWQRNLTPSASSSPSTQSTLNNRMPRSWNISVRCGRVPRPVRCPNARVASHTAIRHSWHKRLIWCWRVPCLCCVSRTCGMPRRLLGCARWVAAWSVLGWIEKVPMHSSWDCRVFSVPSHFSQRSRTDC